MNERASGLVTILFTDLVGSTDLLARAGDEDAQRIFRAHHDLLAQAAASHGGEEVKWLGDGLMVAFPSAADAVRCARAMQQAAHRPVHGERLAIRVGLNAGETLREAADYFGLPVVVARRLCDRAGPGQVLCTDVVAGLLMGRPDFTFSDLGTMDLKGVPRPVQAFAVHHEVEGPAVVPSRMPFVGRSAEVHRLRLRWAEAVSGRGGLVLVSGELGIGKTRLVEELAEYAEGEGAEVLWGRCFEGDWMPPYAAFAEVLETMALTADAGELRADLGAGGPPLAQLTPALRKIAPDLAEPTHLQPLEERFRLLESVAKLLAARAARAPVLLCLDDLQWGDRGSIDAFHHVARQAIRQPLLVVGTYRDAEVGKDHPLAEALGALRRETEYDRLHLGGLPREAIQDLLDALAEHEVAEATAATLTAETDGNPFFLREVLRHLIEEGAIFRGPDGRWTSDVPVGKLGIPEGVREVVERRLARLSVPTNRFLQSASAFEGAFRLDIAAAAAELDVMAALDALDEALTAQLLQPAEGADSYAFTHAVIRHTLYGGLSPSRRVRLHRQVAEALDEAAAGNPTPAGAGEIATQYHRSSPLPGAERGAEAALAAAAHAEATGGQTEAAHFLRMAMDLMADDGQGRARVLARLGMALIWSLAFDEGLDVATRAGEALAAAEGGQAAAEYLAGAALAMGATGNNPRAWELARQGLGYIPERRDLAWARLMVLDFQRREWGDPVHPGIPLDVPERWEVARILQASNPDPVSIGLLEAPFADRAEALARSENISVLVCYAGEFAGTLPLATAAAEQSLARGQIIRAARSFMVVAFCQLSLGRLNEGRVALEEAERLAAPGGVPVFGIRHAREMLTSFLDEDEELERLASEFDELLSTLVPGQAWALGPTYAILARTEARLGRTERALGFLEQLVPWLERAPGWAHHYPQIVGYATETLWSLQLLDNADAVERALEEKVLAPDFRDMEVDARLSMARLRALQGRYAEAVSWFSEARRVLTEQGARPLLAIADHDEALMCLRRGDPGDAHRAGPLLAGARRQFEEIGMTGWALRSQKMSESS
jgi:class 3 adenylate cyclase/tetratricopeptide (TPR) repeat protein